MVNLRFNWYGIITSGEPSFGSSPDIKSIASTTKEFEGSQVAYTSYNDTIIGSSFVTPVQGIKSGQDTRSYQ
jgi:hypothetical protein